MRIPQIPPNFQRLLDTYPIEDNRWLLELSAVLSDGRYLHWDQLG